jgi:hypothetical protein
VHRERVRAGLDPSGRRFGITCREFVRTQAQTILATDFLTVDTAFLKLWVPRKSSASRDQPIFVDESPELVSAS